MNWLLSLTLTCLTVASLVGGCSDTPRGDPFDPRTTREKGVEIQPPLQAAIAGVGSGLGYLTDSLGLSTGPSAREHAEMLTAPDSTPDERIRGINGLVSRAFGKVPPYTDAYARLGSEAQDPLVRAAAIRALNRSRSADHMPLLIEALEDPAEQVRLEAAKALSNLPAPDAATPLLERAADTDEDLDVRIAAVDALRHYGATEELVTALAALLESEAFSVAWQARATLVTMTGTDRGFDATAWRDAAAG